MKKYWLYLEPYIYKSLIDDSVFLYNTLDGTSIESISPNVCKVISQIRESTSGVIELSQSQIEENDIKPFVIQLRNRFMGDIIDTSFSESSPIQFIPILNNQLDVNRLKLVDERSIGEDIMLNLNEIVFFTDNPSVSPNKYYPSTLPLQWKESTNALYVLLSIILQQIPRSIIDNMTVSIVTKDIEKLSNDKRFMGIINTVEIRKRLDIYYQDSVPEKISIIDKLSVTVNVDFPLDEKKFKEIILLQNKIEQIDFTFFISSTEDMEKAGLLINRYEISKYNLIPCYTGQNDIFFEENVFIDKEGLLSEPISMREIFLYQSFNIMYFGKLFINS